jgi:hypothetical protein
VVLNSNSISVGSSLTISGSITPNPGPVLLSLSFSRDAGATWNLLLSLTTDSSGSYSTNWTPPSTGSYLLEASWSGSSQLVGSQSAPASLAVTGSVPPTPTVLLSAPANGTDGQTMTLSLTVFNPTSSVLNANLTISITGPGGYTLFDVLPAKVDATSQSKVFYDWAVPNQPGAYTITLGLLPPTPEGVDIETIQVA